MHMETLFEIVQADGVRVTELRMKPKRDSGGVLVILKGLWNGQKVVTFAGGDNPVTALANTAEKLLKQLGSWREDEPYEVFVQRKVEEAAAELRDDPV